MEMAALIGATALGPKGLPQGGGKEFRAVNPATGEPLDPVYRTATTAQLEAAAGAAHDAAPVLADMPGQQRARFLRAIADRAEAIIHDLVVRAGQETGLPEPRVRGETARTAGQLRLFASIIEEGSWVDARIDPALPDRQPLPRPDLRTMLRPLGPVAVFGASNFPLAYSVAGGDTASALAAGCPVVVKAHPAHPGVSEMVGRAVLEAANETEMPDGVFAVLFDAGHEVGEALVGHPLIKAVGFTGSLHAGRHLFDLAVAREEPIPVYAEMGSVNPVFLLPGALASRGPKIAEMLHQSMTLGTGQFCTKPGLIFTDGNDGFRERLVDLVRATPPGCMLHAGIAHNFGQRVQQMREAMGIESLVSADAARTAAAAGATVLQTTAAALAEDPELASEMFGPATLLVQYTNREEMLAAARALPGQLTATIHGDPEELANSADLISILADRAGRVIFNQVPTGVDVGYAIVHGGPYPATTDSRTTSVGAAAIYRFVRPVCYQNFPDAALPPALQAANPLGIRRTVDGKLELPSAG
jgi:NADP-dependent aldehyde dehydrogenase